MATITKTDVQVTVDRLAGEFELSEWTPYQIHNLVNSTFSELESPRTIRPQMMYNYRRNNLIVKGQTTGNYSTTQVVEFVTKYVAKHV